MPLLPLRSLTSIALVSLTLGCTTPVSDTAPRSPAADQTAATPISPSPVAPAPPQPNSQSNSPSSPPTDPVAANTTDPATPNPASTEPTLPGYFFADPQGIAIHGTDPVAYFTQGEPIPGSATFEFRWGGVTWRFSSAEHQALFAANPEAYVPQYGGYCAWAVSEGYTAPIDPKAWSIVDDRLYLNFNTRIQRRWEQDIPGFIEKANQNWPTVLNQET